MMLLTSNPFAAGAAAGTEVAFPYVAELAQGVYIEGIEVYTDAQLTVSPTLEANVTAADALGIVITLPEKSTQRIKEIPLLAFNSQSNAGIWKELAGFLVNWQAVRLKATIPMAAGTEFVVCLSAMFRKAEDGSGAIAPRPTAPRFNMARR